MKRLSVVVGLLLVLFAPVNALADPFDGFVGGLQDFAGTREVEQVTPESDFEETYVPVVREVETVTETGEDAGPLAWIQQVINRCNQVTVIATNRSLFDTLVWFFGGLSGATFGLMFMPLVAGLVFMWWGVRKAVRMIMTAWRSGRQTA